MSEPNPERDARPKRQVKRPAYLQDFVVQGLGPAKEHPPPSQREDPEVDDAAQASEQVSRNPSPISQLSGRSELLREERQLTMDELRKENDELREHLGQLPQLTFFWRDMKRENEELRNHVRHVPEIMAMLKSLSQENAALKQEFQQLAAQPTQPVTPSLPAYASQPLGTPGYSPHVLTRPESRYAHHPYPAMSSQQQQPVSPVPQYQHPAMPTPQLAGQLRGLSLSDEPPNSSSRYVFQPPGQRTSQQQYVEPRLQSSAAPHLRSGPGLYEESSTFQPLHPASSHQSARQGEERESGQCGRSSPSYGPSGYLYADNGSSRPPHRPATTPQGSPTSTQERVYRGPKPSIPRFSSPDPREFYRLRMALENLLPEDATELFKFQILCNHLKLEEALLIADSYCNSRHPYTDTMHALTRMYGQPHKLVLRHIAEVMDGPNISNDDEKNFRLFALRVRSLVSMLEQLGAEGRAELDCGSHVSRLQSKLPHDLKISFKRFLHPMRIAIPTLCEFSTWLEY